MYYTPISRYVVLFIRMDYELKNTDSFVDYKTAHYYSTKAASLAEQCGNASPGYTRYTANNSKNKPKLLDIGCGSGRDLAEFQAAGFQVTGTDVSEEMLRQAAIKYPSINDSLFNTGLPSLIGLNGKYDVILCSGVIQHIQTQYLYESFRNISSLLNNDGIFIFSFPIDYPGIDPDTERDSNDRLFIIRPEQKYKFLIERQGLKNIAVEKHEDSLNRNGISWAVHVYKKENSDSISPLYKIDSVLRDDSKNTTYKFALLRALSDIASYSYNAAEWYKDGTVGVDVDRIAMKWIEYFWPIISAPKQILQGSNKTDIAFRPYLKELTDSFGGIKGQAGFITAVAKNNISAEQKKVIKATMASMKRAIIEGPIKYSGNSKTGKLFSQYKGKIIIPAKIWKEFVLMGQWIEDSIILRWADFTANITANQAADIKLSNVLDLLLTSIQLKRDTKLAGNIISEINQPIECVWSGKTVREFDIDHALPFSVWRNNDLWNLFPADKKVNNQKRDKFPTVALLNDSRKRIYNYWDIYYESQPAIFLNQATDFCGETFTGFSKDTRELLFAAFSETIDSAALQSGAERWEIG